MRVSLRPLIFSIIPGLLVGCSLLERPPSRPPMLPPDAISTLRARNGRVQSLRGIARMELHYEGRRLRTRQAMALAKPGRMRIETVNVLDQPIFILAADGKSFQAVSLSENRFYFGTVSEGFTRFMHLRMTSRDLISLILGEVPAAGDPLIDYDSRRDLFRLVFLHSVPWDKQIFWVEPERLTIVEVLKTNTSTGRQIRAVFGRFRKTGSVDFPWEIRVEIPGLGNWIKIKFREVEINVPFSEDLFRLSPPPGMSAVEIGASNGVPAAPLGRGQRTP